MDMATTDTEKFAWAPQCICSRSSWHGYDDESGYRYLPFACAAGMPVGIFVHLVRQARIEVVRAVESQSSVAVWLTTSLMIAHDSTVSCSAGPNAYFTTDGPCPRRSSSIFADLDVPRPTCWPIGAGALDAIPHRA